MTWLPSSDKNLPSETSKSASALPIGKAAARYLTRRSFREGHFDARLHARVSSPREGPASCRVRVFARRSHRRLASRLDTHTRSKKPSSLKARHDGRQRARRRLPRADARRAPLLEARDRRRARRRADARALRSIQHRGRYVRRERLAAPRRPALDRRKPFSNRRRARRFAMGQTVLKFSCLVSNSKMRMRALTPSGADHAHQSRRARSRTLD